MSNSESNPLTNTEMQGDICSVNSSLPKAVLAMSRSLVWGLAHPDAYKYYPKKTVETAQRLSQATIPAQVELVA